MGPIDIIVVFLYFIVILGIGYWSFKRGKESSDDYFLAGRDVGWLAVGASLFASNIGSEHLVGLAGSGAAGGFAVGHFEWLASYVLLLLGWIFVPFYLKSRVFTMPEFLELRYGSASRWYLALVSVLGYILTKISVTLFAGAVVIRELTGLGVMESASILILITGLYTIAGGLRAVVYTEVVQTFVLISGSLTLTIIGLVKVGGWGGLTSRVPADFFSMWKPIDHPSFPWTGIVFGAPILGIWYWCTDQYIVQRVLSARDEENARRGAIFAGYLKILPVFIFVLPGVIASALYPDISGVNSDRAFPALVVRLLPVGMKGIVIAGLLAALMSSLSSVFNSCSTLITWDFYRKIRKSPTERELVLVGRIATSIIVILGFLWIPFMKYISSQLYIYLQSVQAYISPPIAACFLFGILTHKVNGAGAIASLVTGFILGALRLILEILNSYSGLPQNKILLWVARVNFLHYAVFLFVISSIVLFSVSLLYNERGKGKIKELVISSDVLNRARKDKSNLILSIILAIIIALLWIAFA
jgi:SSS family solute:Na+ symporter